jgi:hypothetical protein
MIAGVVGFFLSIFAAFFMEYIEKSSSNPENKKRIDEIKKLFPSGLFRKAKSIFTKKNIFTNNKVK